jgi:hypothetical protein
MRVGGLFKVRFTARACIPVYRGSRLIVQGPPIFKNEPPRRKERKGVNIFSSILESRIDENSHPACGRREAILLHRVIPVAREVYVY